MNLKELLDTIESITSGEDGGEWDMFAGDCAEAVPKLRKELKRLKSVKKRLTSEKVRDAVSDYLESCVDACCKPTAEEVATDILKTIRDILFPPKKPKGPVAPQNQAGRTGCASSTVIGATWGSKP
jgi:hypothetical protein